MKITHIEETRVHVPWQDRLKSHLHRFGWSSHQTNYVYQVHTDSDIVGITESAWQLPQSLTRRYIDADPFTHLLDEVSRPLGIAMLDIMGKALNLPAHKLLGQQVREQVSLGYWTCDMGPEELAAEALESSRQGYRWMKIKGRPWFDPIEQLDALSTVVGSDFQIEIDPNGTMMNVEKALPLLRRLERFEQLMALEEPIPAHDLAGYRQLHRQVRIPLLLHWTRVGQPGGRPSGGVTAVREQLVDGFVVNESIGEMLKVGAVLSQANFPCFLQRVGMGPITAFILHLASVLPTATLPAITCQHSWQSNLLLETFKVQGGFVSVPTGPGLGVDLDWEAIRRYADIPEEEIQREVFAVRFGDGRRHFYRADERELERRFLRGEDEGYLPGMRLEVLKDDDSIAFDGLYQRVQKHPVWE